MLGPSLRMRKILEYPPPWGFHASWTFLVLQLQQNAGRRFGTSKMHLSPPWLRLLSVLWICCCCWLVVYCYSLCRSLFVVRYFMSILVLQSSWWGRESWLLYLKCLPGVSWLLCGSSSWDHGFVCSLWLWYFLTILTYYFIYKVHQSCFGAEIS